MKWQSGDHVVLSREGFEVGSGSRPPPSCSAEYASTGHQITSKEPPNSPIPDSKRAKRQLTTKPQPQQPPTPLPSRTIKIRRVQRLPGLSTCLPTLFWLSSTSHLPVVITAPPGLITESAPPAKEGAKGHSFNNCHDKRGNRSLGAPLLARTASRFGIFDRPLSFSSRRILE
jgi:hypothetical protein